MRYEGRLEAGRELARELSRLELGPCVVAGALNGGIAVAEPVARQLGAPLVPLAYFSYRFAASVDDVRATALPALRHRILRSFEGEAEGVAEDKIIDEILKKLPESKA